MSAITIYEIFKLSMEKEGRDVADLRASIIESELDVVSVDSEIAREGD